MSSRLYEYNTIVFDFSSKLSACANSENQALSFPAHREPGYEATACQTGCRRIPK